MEQNQQLVQATKEKAPVPFNQRGIVIHDLDTLWRFSTLIARSGLAPKGMETAEACCIAIQMGMEVGLTPMAALQNIAVINGRPALWGDAQLAVVRGGNALDRFAEEETNDLLDPTFRALCLEDEPDKRKALRLELAKAQAKLDRTKDDYGFTVFVRRKGADGSFYRFTVADAKQAKLWQRRGRDGQDTPWVTHPARMLRFRARSFALRDSFGDMLRGFKNAEEVMDEGMVVDVEANPAPGASLFLPPSTTPLPQAPQREEKVGRKRKAKEPQPEGGHGNVQPAQETPTEEVGASDSGPAPDSQSTAQEQALPPSPQVQLTVAVTQAGHDFDTLKDWSVRVRKLGTMDDVGSFEEIPTATADWMLRNIKGLIGELNRVKERNDDASLG